MHALGAFDLEHRFEGFEPFPGFLRIDVVRVGHEGLLGMRRLREPAGAEWGAPGPGRVGAPL
ncbi:MAG: hypothetical protein KatS3mg121_0541 [Gammaproteobacteria bacterium]|nr:MAG: hypothetical protein KatS3mg121_0541 [Gammaproteobacteria bacterium]